MEVSLQSECMKRPTAELTGWGVTGESQKHQMNIFMFIVCILLFNVYCLMSIVSTNKFTYNIILIMLYFPNYKVKVTRDRPRWPKGFRVG